MCDSMPPDPQGILPPEIGLSRARRRDAARPPALLFTFHNSNLVGLMLGTGAAHQAWLSVRVTDPRGRPAAVRPDLSLLPADWGVSLRTRLPAGERLAIVLPLHERFVLGSPGRYQAELAYRLAYAVEGTPSCAALERALIIAHAHMRTLEDPVRLESNGLFPFATGTGRFTFTVGEGPSGSSGR